MSSIMRRRNGATRSWPRRSWGCSCLERRLRTPHLKTGRSIALSHLPRQRRSDLPRERFSPVGVDRKICSVCDLLILSPERTLNEFEHALATYRRQLAEHRAVEVPKLLVWIGRRGESVH